VVVTCSYIMSENVVDSGIPLDRLRGSACYISVSQTDIVGKRAGWRLFTGNCDNGECAYSVHLGG